MAFHTEDYYRVLKVRHDCSRLQIHAGYVNEAILLGLAGVVDDEDAVRIETAYRVLIDSTQRANYDRHCLWRIRQAAADEAKAARLQVFQIQDRMLDAAGETRNAHKRRLIDFWEHEHRIDLVFTLEKLKHQWHTMPYESQRLKLLHNFNVKIREVWERINISCRCEFSDDPDSVDDEKQIQGGGLVFGNWPNLSWNDELNDYFGQAQDQFHRSQDIMRALMTEHACYGNETTSDRKTEVDLHTRWRDILRDNRMADRMVALQNCFSILADAETSINNIVRTAYLYYRGPATRRNFLAEFSEDSEGEGE